LGESKSIGAFTGFRSLTPSPQSSDINSMAASSSAVLILSSVLLRPTLLVDSV
jgi:hypothetical protein